MTTKHKKGPWRIGAVESGRVAIDSADGQEVTGFIDPEDAPLILSAPDLLEALRCACNYIDKLGGTSSHYRALLARATGESE